MSNTNYVKLECNGRETRMFELPTDMETIKKGFSAYRLTDEYQIFRKIPSSQLMGTQSYWKKVEVGELQPEGKYRLFLSYPKFDQEPPKPITPPEKFGFTYIRYQQNLFRIPLPTNMTEIKKVCHITSDRNLSKDYWLIEEETEETSSFNGLLNNHTYFLIDKTKF
jgi:hypothetical protein